METVTFKIRKTRLIRAIVQIVFFLFLPALFVSTFSGIKAIYTSIVGGTFNFTELLPQIIEVIAIVPLTIFVGRFFCGWMCAFGSLQDLIYLISKKTMKRRVKIDPMLDRGLKIIKYVVLVLIVAAIWTFDFKVFSAANPWDAFAMIFTIGKLPNFIYIFQNILPALIILLLILAASFFIQRFFCRYLCPLGAIFSIISKLRLTSIVKHRDKCKGCTLCTSTCPMGINLKNMDKTKSGECINCFECVSVCPKKNAVFAVNENDIRPIVAGAVTVAAISGIYLAGSYTSDIVSGTAVSVNQTQQNRNDNNTNQNGENSQQRPGKGGFGDKNFGSDNNNDNSNNSNSDDSGNFNNNQQNEQSSSQTNETQSTTYKDGNYEGSGTGFHGGTTTVKVTVSGGIITDVSLVSSEDTERYIEYAFPKITEEIKDEQTYNVSAVSGATYSSAGIMEAVKNALVKAE